MTEVAEKKGQVYTQWVGGWVGGLIIRLIGNFFISLSGQSHRGKFQAQGGLAAHGALCCLEPYFVLVYFPK